MTRPQRALIASRREAAGHVTPGVSAAAVHLQDLQQYKIIAACSSRAVGSRDVGSTSTRSWRLLTPPAMESRSSARTRRGRRGVTVEVAYRRPLVAHRRSRVQTYASTSPGWRYNPNCRTSSGRDGGPTSGAGDVYTFDVTMPEWAGRLSSSPSSSGADGQRLHPDGLGRVSRRSRRSVRAKRGNHIHLSLVSGCPTREAVSHVTRPGSEQYVEWNTWRMRGCCGRCRRWG